MSGLLIFELIFGVDASAPKVTASPLSEEGKINVSWTVPHVSRGSSIKGYSIQYKVSSSSGAYLNISDPGSSATNIVISDLHPGEDYIIRVAAKTELGVQEKNHGSTQVITYDCTFMWSPDIEATSCNFVDVFNSYSHYRCSTSYSDCPPFV